MSYSAHNPGPSDQGGAPRRGRLVVRWTVRRAASPQPAQQPATPTPPSPPTSGGDRHLNLLLTYGGWRESSWADALPRLLEPMGVRSFRANSGAEAAQVLRSVPVHAAVVDLRLPLDRPHRLTTAGESPDPALTEEGGERLLEVLRRLEAPPPTVVVTRDRSPREYMRELHYALRHGAYAVVHGSAADAEQMLRVLQRLVSRYYHNQWPDCTGGGPTPGGSSNDPPGCNPDAATGSGPPNN